MTKRVWIKYWIISVVFMILTLFVIIIYWNLHGRPLRFTSFLSYDAKLNFVRNNKLLEKADTLVVGSSMGLNNVNGRSLEKSEKIDFTCNISAWGMKTSEVYELLQAVKLDKIKRVIYISQYFDFDSYSLRNIDKNNIRMFLDGKFVLSAYLNSFYSLNKNFSNYLFWKKRYLNNTQYNYLGFNKNGDINITLTKDRINQDRWNKFSKNPRIDEKNIEALVNMNKYLKEKNIKFIVATTPHRIQIFNENKKLLKFFDKFSDRLKSLSSKYQFTYINIHNILQLDDSNFIDSSHLNTKGAKQTSLELIKHI